eukprot:751340_1
MVIMSFEEQNAKENIGDRHKWLRANTHHEESTNKKKRSKAIGTTHNLSSLCRGAATLSNKSYNVMLYAWFDIVTQLIYKAYIGLNSYTLMGQNSKPSRTTIIQ